MDTQAKMKLAERLAKALDFGYINMEEANQIWIQQTGEDCYWPQEYL